MNKEITIYTIHLDWDNRDNSIKFIIAVWKGTETKSKFKMKLVSYDGKPDELSAFDYKLWDKNCIEHVYMGDSYASVRTLNEEAIEDWKYKLGNDFYNFKKKEADQALWEAQNISLALSAYENNKNKEE